MAESLGRVNGTEMEWAIREFDPKSSDNRQLPAAELNPFISAYMSDRGLSCPGGTNGNRLYLTNGACCYPDCGEHREYDTAEDTSTIGTMAGEIAGERIIYDALHTIINGDPSRELKNVHMFKRVIDRVGATWGYHQSLLADLGTYRRNKSHEQSSDIVSETGLALMGIHMATYNIYAGAGVLRPDGSYAIAQKALGIEDDFNSNCTSKKAVISLRREALADSDRFSRVHITSADANIMPWAMRMSLGTKDIVLSLIEQGYSLPNLRFKGEKPLHIVMGAVATDPLLENGYQMEKGKRLSAIQIQNKLLEAGQDLDRNSNLSDEQKWTLQEWSKALAALEQNPELLKYKSDWVTRLARLKSIQDKKGWSWDSGGMRAVDIKYDEMGPDSLATKLRKGKKAGEYMPPEELIVDRMQNPPATTRAWIRGNTLRDYPNMVTGADWEHLTINGKQFRLKDPYETEMPSLNEAIAYELERAQQKAS